MEAAAPGSPGRLRWRAAAAIVAFLFVGGLGAISLFNHDEGGGQASPRIAIAEPRISPPLDEEGSLPANPALAELTFPAGRSESSDTGKSIRSGEVAADASPDGSSEEAPPQEVPAPTTTAASLADGEPGADATAETNADAETETRLAVVKQGQEATVEPESTAPQAVYGPPVPQGFGIVGGTVSGPPVPGAASPPVRPQGSLPGGPPSAGPPPGF